MDEAGVAIRQFLRRHGHKWHRKPDDCVGCTRLAALEFVQDLPLDFGEKSLLAEWIASDEFDSVDGEVTEGRSGTPGA